MIPSIVFRLYSPLFRLSVADLSAVYPQPPTISRITLKPDCSSNSSIVSIAAAFMVFWFQIVIEPLNIPENASFNSSLAALYADINPFSATSSSFFDALSIALSRLPYFSISSSIVSPCCAKEEMTFCTDSLNCCCDISPLSRAVLYSTYLSIASCTDSVVSLAAFLPASAASFAASPACTISETKFTSAEIPHDTSIVMPILIAADKAFMPIFIRFSLIAAPAALIPNPSNVASPIAICVAISCASLDVCAIFAAKASCTDIPFLISALN